MPASLITTGRVSITANVHGAGLRRMHVKLQNLLKEFLDYFRYFLLTSTEYKIA